MSVVDFKTNSNDITLHKGEIWMIDLPKIEGSRLQYGVRPCIVYCNDRALKYSPIIDVIPLTSQVKNKIPVHVEIGTEFGLVKPSIALIEQKRPVDKKFFKYKIAQCPQYVLGEIQEAIDIQNGVDEITKELKLYASLIKQQDYAIKHSNKIKDKEENIMVKNILVKKFREICGEELYYNTMSYKLLGYVA